MITAKSISVKQWVLGAVTVLLIGIMIAANAVVARYSFIINRVFSGGTTGEMSGDATVVLQETDNYVQRVAEDSMVLLKNDNGFLPKADLKKVNLFGYGSTDNGLLLVGGGSGGTTILDKTKEGEDRIKIDITDAFKAAEIEYNTDVIAAYEDFSKYDSDWRSGGTTGANAAESLINPDASFYTDALMDGAKAFSDTAIVTLSRFGAENGGSGELKNIGKYSNGDFLRLTSEERALFDKLAAKNFDVIVLLNVCNNIELGFLDEYSNIKACLYIGIPGQSGCAVIPDILTGKINPSGKMSDTLAYDYSEYNPVWYNATNVSNSLIYQEGIYFGYKWYETADKEGLFAGAKRGNKTGYDAVVQYPFGYGLSYSDFEWTVKSRSWNDKTDITEDGKYSITVTVHNNGPYSGKDVVQLYMTPQYKQGGVEKAYMNLIAFEKTPEIKSGASVDVTLEFSAYDLASYDMNGNNGKGCYVVDGDYDIKLMDDAHHAAKMANGADSSFLLAAAEKIEYTQDPKTGETVENRFTGDNAYADCPIDGGVQYLSRQDKFANIPTRPAAAPSTSVEIDYRYQGYNNVDVSSYKYGENATGSDRLVLTYVVHTEKDAEGNDVVVKEIPTDDQLTGREKLPEGYSFENNKELIEQLSDYDNDDVWNELLNQLTESYIKNLIGRGGFQTFAIESIGKPLCTDKDGPAGFNNNVTNGGNTNHFTIWPSESLTGCSWSKETAKLVGEGQGRIASSMGLNGWYGPGVNLHRSVYNSRNYEYYSEDPVLSGHLAAQTIKAAKENNLYCYLKHFAVSEAGQNPTTWKTWVTEQALRESYLRAFEIALKESEGNGVMSAFNCLGGVLAGYNHALLTDILRTEWGFNGSVITDWYTGGKYMGNHESGVLGGNDLWLCGSTDEAAKLDLSKPEIAFAARRSAKNIIYTYAVTAGAVKIIEEPTSAAFIALWVVLDVLLFIGISLCVTFIVLDAFMRKKKVPQAAATEESTEPTPSDEHIEERTEEHTEE